MIEVIRSALKAPKSGLAAIPRGEGEERHARHRYRCKAELERFAQFVTSRVAYGVNKPVMVS